MAVQKIKKTSWLRRRFIEGPRLKTSESWLDEASRLKDQILTETTFQLVGEKIHLSYHPSTKACHALFEVLGIPGANLPYRDFEACSVLICDLDFKLFDVDFLTIIERAESLRQKITHSLEDTFHIVLEGENLALHFFIQKDYIQASDP